MLKKMLIIISIVKKRNARFLKKNHKFGIDVPKSVAQSYALDKNNGNIIWAYAIAKKMKDVSPEFRKLYSGDIVPILYQHVKCHIIFYVRM